MLQVNWNGSRRESIPDSLVATIGSIFAKTDYRFECLTPPSRTCGGRRSLLKARPRADVRACASWSGAVPAPRCSAFQIHCCTCNVEAWRELYDRSSTHLLLFLQHCFGFSEHHMSWPCRAQRNPFSGRHGLTCGNSSTGRKIARDATCHGVGRNTSSLLFERVEPSKAFANSVHWRVERS